MASPYGAIDATNISTEHDERKLTFSVGRVMDTNDPKQMGRIRVYIPGVDRNTSRVRDLPFAIYCAPFAGHQQKQSRGPTDDAFTTGPVAYGMFAIPKVGTDVIVGCLNGDPNIRIWFGALYGDLLDGTLPHGRYLFDTEGNLDGPLSASEHPIQPLYDNYTEAYTRTTATAINDGGKGLPPRKNFEWRARGMDYQAAGLGNIQKNLDDQVVSSVADNRNYSFTEEDGRPFKGGDYTQGYAESRIEPNLSYDPSMVDGGKNLDPQTYSITTPGFNSLSMDDRPENARVRLRTGSGHQIILDDTNERIYISTATGNTWVEMDQCGNVDIYAARRVSIHSEIDVNITTGGTFRVTAKGGIHMDSEGEVRITSKKDTHIRSYKSTRVRSNESTNISSGGAMNVLAGTTLNISSSAATNINSGGLGAWTSGASLNFNASGNILQTASKIHMNGPTAATAKSAEQSGAHDAYFTNRVPEHEPWGRIMMAKSATDNDSGNQFLLELPYTSREVGRLELGEVIPRNPRWHR